MIEGKKRKETYEEYLVGGSSQLQSRHTPSDEEVSKDEVKRQPSSGGGMYHSEIKSEMQPSGSGGSDIKNILNAVGGGSFK